LLLLQASSLVARVRFFAGWQVESFFAQLVFLWLLKARLWRRTGLNFGQK
jgi:hypothetical protein